LVDLAAGKESYYGNIFEKKYPCLFNFFYHVFRAIFGFEEMRCIMEKDEVK